MKIHLQQQNMLVGIPVLMSSRGYGIFWDNPSITDVASGAAADKPGTIQWSSEVGDAIDYYVLYGPDLDQSIADYRFLTGSAPMFGRWAWGFWQSKERYASQDELLWIVDQYRSRHIPIDGIIQDWQYWSPGPWGSHKLDPSRYYDPKGLLQKLHANNIHMLISVWAKFDPGRRTIANCKTPACFFRRTSRACSPRANRNGTTLSMPRAAEIYWQQISRNLFSHGIDGWWLDATEPELSGKWGEFRDYHTAAGRGHGLQRLSPHAPPRRLPGPARADRRQRVFILTRSAYAGQQRNAAMTWSGDIPAPGMFSPADSRRPEFLPQRHPLLEHRHRRLFRRQPRTIHIPELFTRWFQFGAFCPMFRVHGTDQPKEIWRFRRYIQKSLMSDDQLRYRLLPYIYSTAWSVTHDDSTMMRGARHGFPHDTNVLNIPDQYMFGPAHDGQSGHSGREPQPAAVYLPARPDVWFDFWTGKSLSGGQTINAPPPSKRFRFLFAPAQSFPSVRPWNPPWKKMPIQSNCCVYAWQRRCFQPL